MDSQGISPIQANLSGYPLHDNAEPNPRTIDEIIVDISQQALSTDFSGNIKKLQAIVKYEHISSDRIREILAKSGFQTQDISKIIDNVSDITHLTQREQKI